MDGTFSGKEALRRSALAIKAVDQRADLQIILVYLYTDTNYTSLSSKAVRAVHQRVKLSSLFALFLGSGQLRSAGDT